MTVNQCSAFFFSDRIWKLRLSKITKPKPTMATPKPTPPPTCTITRIVADKIQASYKGPRVIGTQSKEICRPGQKSSIGITNTQAKTKSITASRSRSSTTSHSFGVKIGISATVTAGGDIYGG